MLEIDNKGAVDASHNLSVSDFMNGPKFEMHCECDECETSPRWMTHKGRVS